MCEALGVWLSQKWGKKAVGWGNACLLLLCFGQSSEESGISSSEFKPHLLYLYICHGKKIKLILFTSFLPQFITVKYIDIWYLGICLYSCPGSHKCYKIC